MNNVWKWIIVLLILAVAALTVAVVRLSDGQEAPDTGLSDPLKETPENGGGTGEESGGDADGETDTDGSGEKEEEIQSLRCSVTKGVLTIVPGDAFGASDGGGNSFTAYTEDGVYVVEGDSTADSQITVTVPQDTVLSSISLRVSGGTLTASGIAAEALDTSCSDGTLEFSGKVTGGAEISHQRGKTVLTLEGKPDDYNYELEYDLGHIGIGEQQFAGAGGSRTLDNGADRTIRIQCAMGSVSLLFS